MSPLPIPDFIVITILIFFAIVLVLESRRGSRKVNEKEAIRELAAKVAMLDHELHQLRREVRELAHHLHHPHRHLKSIEIAFTEGTTMTAGPANLNVGQSVTATILGFDQFGQPFTIDFTANPVSWGIDQPGIASFTSNADKTATVTGVAAGTANLSAQCGAFSDSAQVIVAGQQAPVLSSIKIDFGTPTP